MNVEERAVACGRKVIMKERKEEGRRRGESEPVQVPTGYVYYRRVHTGRERAVGTAGAKGCGAANEQSVFRVLS